MLAVPPWFPLLRALSLLFSIHAVIGALPARLMAWASARCSRVIFSLHAGLVSLCQAPCTAEVYLLFSFNASAQLCHRFEIS